MWNVHVKFRECTAIWLYSTHYTMCSVVHIDNTLYACMLKHSSRLYVNGAVFVFLSNKLNSFILYLNFFPAFWTSNHTYCGRIYRFSFNFTWYVINFHSKTIGWNDNEIRGPGILIPFNTQSNRSNAAIMTLLCRAFAHVFGAFQ